MLEDVNNNLLKENKKLKSTIEYLRSKNSINKKIRNSYIFFTKLISLIGKNSNKNIRLLIQYLAKSLENEPVLYFKISHENENITLKDYSKNSINLLKKLDKKDFKFFNSILNSSSKKSFPLQKHNCNSELKKFLEIFGFESLFVRTMKVDNLFTHVLLIFSEKRSRFNKINKSVINAYSSLVREEIRKLAIQQKNVNTKFTKNKMNKVGFWSWNIKTGKMSFDKNTADLLNISIDELNNYDIEKWNKLCHPEDISHSGEVLNLYFEDELESYDCDLRMKNGLGKYIWMHEQGEISEYDANDKPLVMVGTTSDINEFKKSEIELKSRENKYRRLIETTNTGYVISSRDGFVIDANKEYVRLSGHKDLKEIIGRNIQDWIAPHDKKLKIKDLKEWLKKGQINHLEIDFVDKKGEITPVEINSKIGNASNNFQVYSVCRDISEKIRTKRELDIKNQAFESAHEGFVILDKQKRIIFTNRAFKRFFSKDTSELKYKSFGDILKIDLDIIYRQFEMDGVVNDQISILNDSDILSHFSLSLQKIIDSSGNFSYILGIISDISKRILYEKEARELQNQILKSQKVETIGALSSGIAHDFNNLLTPILGFSDYALQKLDVKDEYYDEFCEIKNAAIDGQKIIAQIKDFGKNTEEQIEQVDFSSLINTNAKRLSRILPSIIKIDIDIEPNLPNILIDSVRLNQIILNLGTNAYQAIGEKTGKISFQLKKVIIDKNFQSLKAGEYFKFSVSDTGCGISEKNRAKIFNRFYTTKEKNGGTGLGLSIVNRIVKNYEGDIFIDSKVDKGTKIDIYLPDIKRGNVKKEKLFLSKNSNEIKNLHGNILVVDDNVAITNLLKKFISSVGFNVKACMSGQEALDIYFESNIEFDLIISDLSMPEITGLDIAKKINKHNIDLPILIITGFGENLNMNELKEFGIRDVIFKPLLFDELLSSIKKNISLS